MTATPPAATTVTNPAATRTAAAPATVRPATRSLTGRLAAVPRPAAYPILLALLAPVSMYNGVADQLAFGSALRAIIVAGILGLAVAALITAIVRDKDRGAVLAATVIMVIGWGRQPMLVALPIIVLVFLGLDKLNQRRGRPALPWHLVTTLMTLGVSIALGANIIAAVQTTAPWQPQPPIQTGLAAAAPGTLQDPSLDPTNLPDVYLVLLDGHARLDTLDTLGVPTDGIRADLAEAGLTVAEDAHTSYGFTALVLSSMFNGDHLDDLEADGVIDRAANGGIDTWNAIQRGRMLQRFRDAGYQIVTVSPGFDHVELRSADRYLDTGQMGLFEFKLLNRGLFGALAERFYPELPFDELRNRIKDQFTVTGDLAGEPSAQPRLVFTHLPAPHGPLVFNADGTARPSDGMDSYENESPHMARVGVETWAKEYGGHLLYTDELAMDMIRRIVDRDPDAVIVLFSDHGHQWVRFPYGSLDDEPLAEFGDMTQRSKVLLAARTPGKEGVITPDQGLVNLLGRILHAYTGQPWADQPERLFDCTPDAARCTPWLKDDALAGSPNAASTRTAWVAKATIPTRFVIQPDMLVARVVSEGASGPSVGADLEELVGRVTAVTVEAGQPIALEQLVDPNDLGGGSTVLDPTETITPY